MKFQKGFLLITAALLIVLASIIMAASYMFVTSAESQSNSSQAQKALYIASSGMEVASRYLLEKNISCSNITGNGDLTNASFGGGQYTITGTLNNNETTLSGLINETATSIPLTSSTGFPSSGIVIIDNEYIYYPSISGNSLTNVFRGAANTVPATHLRLSKVTQNQCLLTSTAAYPNFLYPMGKKSIQRLFLGTTLQVPISGTINANPVLISANNVTLNNNASIINPNVTASSTNFNGSSIISRGNVTLNKNGVTQINSSSGLVVSSSKGNLKADVMPNTTTITSTNLFGYFFNQSKTTVRLGSNQSYNASNINGASGITIWVTGNLILNGTTTVGTTTHPVILIVNGRLTMNDSAKIYGFVYSTNDIILNKSNLIIGAAAGERNITLNFTSSIQYDQSILNEVQVINNYLITSFIQTPAATLELYM